MCEKQSAEKSRSELEAKVLELQASQESTLVKLATVEKASQALQGSIL
jgi:hypothetical protein